MLHEEVQQLETFIRGELEKLRDTVQERVRQSSDPMNGFGLEFTSRFVRIGKQTNHTHETGKSHNQTAEP